MIIAAIACWLALGFLGVSLTNDRINAALVHKFRHHFTKDSICKRRICKREVRMTDLVGILMGPMTAIAALFYKAKLEPVEWEYLYMPRERVPAKLDRNSIVAVGCAGRETARQICANLQNGLDPDKLTWTRLSEIHEPFVVIQVVGANTVYRYGPTA